MALFRSRKQNVFQPASYGYSRRKRGMPRWLVLMLTGIALGAGGVLFVQKSYGPTLLTLEESRQLHQSLDASSKEVQILTEQLEQHKRDLAQAQERTGELDNALATANNKNQLLQGDIAILADAVAPDPRGTSPGIRAASFKNTDDMLDYSLLVMQDEANASLFTGEMVFVVQGVYPNGRGNTVTLDAVPVSFGHYARLEGQAPLPDGLKARQVTVRITPEGSSKLSAMRVLNVQR